MSKEAKLSIWAWAKKHNSLVLKISGVLFLLCYALTYLSGMSNNTVFMTVTIVVLVFSNLLPAAL